MKKIILPIFFAILGLISSLHPLKIYASWEKYSNNPVVKFGSSGEFDSLSLSAPSVIYKNSQYMMWYEAYGGFNLNIGYATSNNETDWNKQGQIVINTSEDPYSFHISDPEVIYEDGIYKMWYVASSSNWNNYHIDYSTSTDGLNWNKPTLNVLVPSLPWELGQGISFPSVLHVGNSYKMWYAGSGPNGFWQIGYATSPDGINWTKNLDPVFVADSLSWEGQGIAGPEVILNNGLYEMWYHGGLSIGHATSTNGIDWIRDSNNPVITPSQNFDSSQIDKPFVLRLNGQNKMWYGGTNNTGRWQIGYAGEVLPTPTATPTLTPTPAGPNPIILIPGMGASWNQSDMLSCDLSQSNDWTLAPYVKVYDRLINTFVQNVGLTPNQEFYVYAYDWRQNMETAGKKLKTYIDNVLVNRPYNNVELVSHSLGGLVASSYIQQYANHRVDKLITLGSPHKGTALAYPIWENGEVWVSNLVQKAAIDTLINVCRLKNPPVIKTKREVVHDAAPSVRDILPTFDFIIKNNQLIVDPLIEGENLWLSSHQLDSSFNGVNLFTFSGNGKDTLSSIEVKNPNPHDITTGDWQDGKPIKRINTNLGDGTILSSSSLVDGASQRKYDTDHTGLVTDSQSIQEVLNILGFSAVSPAQSISLPESNKQSALIVTSDSPAFIILSDLQDNLIQSSDKGIVIDYNDKSTKYKLKIKPTNTGLLKLYIGQSGINDNWISQEKQGVANQELQFVINYNPNNPDKNLFME